MTNEVFPPQTMLTDSTKAEHCCRANNVRGACPKPHAPQGFGGTAKGGPPAKPAGEGPRAGFLMLTALVSASPAEHTTRGGIN